MCKTKKCNILRVLSSCHKKRKNKSKKINVLDAIDYNRLILDAEQRIKQAIKYS